MWRLMGLSSTRRQAFSWLEEEKPPSELQGWEGELGRDWEGCEEGRRGLEGEEGWDCVGCKVVEEAGSDGEGLVTSGKVDDLER